MTLIAGLVIITLLYILSVNAIKKVPVIFYIGFYLWQAIVIAYYGLELNNQFPSWFTTYFMDIFQRGMFSTITFIIVMYLGVITKHNTITKKLMSIRGELSIIGCLSVICHNIIFGVVYFPAFVQHPELMTTRNKAASIVSIILLVIMIPLFITSFKCIRKKMNAKSWKKLQRFAYPFYFLIYVHVIILFTADIEAHLSGIIIYTIIYATYAILRLRKFFIQKAKKQKRLVAKEV